MEKIYDLMGGFNLLFKTTYFKDTIEYSFISNRNSARLTFNSCYKDKVIKELNNVIKAVKDCGYSDGYRTGLGHLACRIPSCYGNNWQVSDIKKVIEILKHSQVKELKELSREQLKEKLNRFSIIELEGVINDIQQK